MGKTYYENFGFIPKNNNSNKNVFNKINSAFIPSKCNYFYDFLSFYLKDKNLPYHKELL